MQSADPAGELLVGGEKTVEVEVELDLLAGLFTTVDSTRLPTRVVELQLEVQFWTVDDYPKLVADLRDVYE